MAYRFEQSCVNAGELMHGAITLCICSEHDEFTEDELQLIEHMLGVLNDNLEEHSEEEE